MKLLLDTSILAKVCHPSKHRDVQAWLHAVTARKPPAHEILASALSLYELRAGLRKSGANESLAQLERLADHLSWQPVTADTAARAAHLRERVAAEDAPGLSDADFLIAAQAAAESAVLVSSDQDLLVSGRQLGLDVRDWSEIDPAVP